MKQLSADIDSIIKTKFDEAFPNTILNGFPPRRVVYKVDHEKLRDEIIEEITETIYKNL